MGKGQLTPQSMFKLFQDLIVVLVTCKNEDPIKNEGTTGLRPIYVMFFRFLLISFQMKNNDDMWVGKSLKFCRRENQFIHFGSHVHGH